MDWQRQFPQNRLPRSLSDPWKPVPAEMSIKSRGMKSALLHVYLSGCPANRARSLLLRIMVRRLAPPFLTNLPPIERKQQPPVV